MRRKGEDTSTFEEDEDDGKRKKKRNTLIYSDENDEEMDFSYFPIKPQKTCRPKRKNSSELSSDDEIPGPSTSLQSEMNFSLSQKKKKHTQKSLSELSSDDDDLQPVLPVTPSPPAPSPATSFLSGISLSYYLIIKNAIFLT
ncbi:uncharacterized protein [Antedon mediterranea]|uniref:uncharacterized protein n=1 Tax=Antedon mediterranea TaxID=105859 RepID=UPI003AF8B944